jgi:hypothetical protein
VLVVSVAIAVTDVRFAYADDDPDAWLVTLFLGFFVYLFILRYLPGMTGAR